MKGLSKTALAILAASCLALPSSAQEPGLLGEVMGESRRLSAFPSRISGGEGCTEAAALIKESLRELRSVSLVSQHFDIEVPWHDEAHVEVVGGGLDGRHRTYPLWPELVRLNTTPPGGIGGRPVYCGDGALSGLPGKSLAGQIAVMEMAHGRNWKNPFMMGATAMILLGGEREDAVLPGEQPICKPRFYVEDGPLAEAFRRGEISSVTIHAAGRWRASRAENIYALIRGTDPELAPIVLMAGYDAMSVVPQLAPGANAAVDAAFLLGMARHFDRHRPRRGAILVFADAMCINNLGPRMMFSLLASTPEDGTRRAYEKMERKILAEYELAASLVAGFRDDAEALAAICNKRRHKELQRYCKDELSPEMIALREANGQLRLKLAAAGEPAVRERFADELAANTARLDFLNRTLLRLVGGKASGEDVEAYALATWARVRQRVAAQLETQRGRLSFFAENDRIRRHILDFLGVAEGRPNPCGYVIAVDLSDAGAVVGPALFCRQTLNVERDVADEFTRWLREAMQRGEQFLAPISEDKLDHLGAGDAAVRDLVDRVLLLDVESQDQAELHAEIRKEFPGLEAASIRAIVKDLSALGERCRPGVREIIARHAPDIGRRRLDALAAAIMNRPAIEGREIPEAFSLEPMMLPTSPARSFRMKAVTWATLEGGSSRADTPADRFGRLDWSRLSPQICATALMLELVMNDTAFAPQPLNISGMPRWRMPHGSIVSESEAETISRTPMPGFLAVMTSNVPWTGLNLVKGIRAHELVRTQADGSFRFLPHPSPPNWTEERRRVHAYQLDESGAITHGLSDSTSMLAGSMESVVYLRRAAPLNPVRSLAFPCVELNGPVIFDPRFQQPLNSFTLIDPVRGGSHRRAHFSVFSGQTFGLLPPNARWQLIMRSGLQRNRMILMNVSPKIRDAGSSLADCIRDGFPAGQDIPPLPEMQSAWDMHRVDGWRIGRLEKAGISIPAAKAVHEAAGKLLAEAEKCYGADDGGGAVRAARAALASELRAYHAIQAQADDVTRGVIFLLILLVPFAVAMERLLFATVRIGHQILASTGIFATMLAVLWSFHPGFRISGQPLIILMAFIILLLSLAVIIIVMRKFKSGLDEVRRGRSAEGVGAVTSRGGVIASAIWLGIANMRKRLLRTLLTASTIVIITFALLCFTSSSTYQDKRIFTLDVDPAAFPTGILLQHPAMRGMANETEENIRLLLGKEHPVAGRRWIVSTNPSWRLIVRNPATGGSVSLKAALLLAPEERLLSRPQDVLSGWDEFAKGDGCYLSRIAAERLGVAPGDRVAVGGREFRLIDAYDPLAVERGLRKLDGQSLLPIDYSIEKDNWTMSQEAMEGQISGAGGAGADVLLRHCSGDDTAILPRSFAEGMGGGLRGVAVHSAPEKARELAEKLMHTVVYPIYYNDGQQVRAIVSTPLLPKAPGKILIPMLIAALIIFNTMLNSVAERKGEIHIYTSLGLAPSHVGMLFLAEAATYGLMGTVFGYIVGQGLATLLTSLDLMGGVTLNYSGTSVVMTMGLVLAVVLFSAIVPAIMAAKVANPGKEGDWQVPKPVGDEIRDLLPFTVTVKAAKGLACFIHEYMEAHRDGAIGNFTSDRLAMRGRDAESLAGVSATVWLAPYDLGVRQEVNIEVVPDVDEICTIRVRLARGAGQERSWWRLNKVFLGDIRRQLLGWRNISVERVVGYIEKGEKVI